MICQTIPANIEKYREYFTNAVQDYKYLNMGDRFLIAILDCYNTDEFVFDLVLKK